MAKNKTLRLPFGPSAERPPPRTKSSKADRQELFLPVSGFAWFYPEEVEVIDHPAFQRLGRINQLGMAHLVFRGATHKRIEHALGCVSIAQRMMSAVDRNSGKARGQSSELKLAPDEERFIRLGALLHDVGHLAAGHTIEDELGLLPPHDGQERLTWVFDKTEFGGGAVESLGSLIDRLYEIYLPAGLGDRIKPSGVVKYLVGKIDDSTKEREDYKSLENSSEIRLGVGQSIIGNTICADLLDYLFRDWYHVGKPRAFDERILQYMEIVSGTGSIYLADARRSPKDRFVVALGRSPKIRTDGVSAILELLEWRYQLAETVLFHRTKLSAAAMLDRAIFELWGEGGDQQAILDTVFPLSDEQLIDELERIASARTLDAKSEEQERLQITIENLRSIRVRTLFRGLKTWSAQEIGNGDKNRARALYGSSNAGSVTGGPDSRQRAINRAAAMRELERDFRMRPGSLAMYCSEAKPKIAEVSVLVGDEVETFERFEKANENVLSGGHLEAQLNRFKWLWRVHFFIDPTEEARLKENSLLPTLVHAIDALVLGRTDDVEAAARDLALVLAGRSGSGWERHPVLDAAAQAARRGDERGDFRGYPTGSPSIRSFFGKIARESKGTRDGDGGATPSVE